jgi:hypothetical protein
MSKDQFGGFAIKCQRCNSPFTVYSPGKDYIKILETACPRGDSMITNNFCPSCQFQNKTIWDMDHNLPFNRDQNSDLGIAGVD